MLYCEMLIREEKMLSDYSIFKRFQSLSAWAVMSKLQKNALDMDWAKGDLTGPFLFWETN